MNTRMTIVGCLLVSVGVLLPSTLVLADTPWQAGAASVVITPEKYMWMAGYGSRKEPANGKLTELWAKALVLDDTHGNRGVVITLDLVGIDRELSRQVCERLEKAYSLNRQQIVICTSHTHSGPVVGKNLAPLHYLGVDQNQQKLIDENAKFLVEKIVDVVGDANAKLAPSRLQWGNGHESFAVNRRNNPSKEVPDRREHGTLAGPVDHDVPVLSVRDADGKLTAVLFGYACHATCISFQQWCGDYPGYAQIELEKLHPDCVAMFWAGCGADQNPLPRRTIELAKEYGAELAEAVDEVLSAALPELPAKLDLRFTEVNAPLSQLPTSETLQTDAAPAKPTGSYQERWARYLLHKIESEGALKNHYPYPVSVWTIGDEIDFITLGGEVVVDYALRLKRERRGNRTWVAGYSNDVMAYIPSLRVLTEGGYEGGGSNVYYGLPSLWGEQIEETIVKSVHELSPMKRQATQEF
jgi:neutral ceramidase